VLQTLIALKNVSSLAGFEPGTLGPMASTLDIRPPRTSTDMNSVRINCCFEERQKFVQVVWTQFAALPQRHPGGM
jgi:hypothetical protein